MTMIQFIFQQFIMTIEGPIHGICYKPDADAKEAAAASLDPGSALLGRLYSHHVHELVQRHAGLFLCEPGGFFHPMPDPAADFL